MSHRPYKHIIELSNNERRELKALVSNGKTERRLADRARMILWADEGVTFAETQRRLGCSEQIVLNWWRDFLARRTGSTFEPIRIGRHRADPESGRDCHLHQSEYSMPLVQARRPQALALSQLAFPA